MLRTPIVLASASPRRRELLASVGLTFTVDPADVDEESMSQLEPRQQAVALAELKAGHVARRYADAVVIGADTIVTVDGQALGKPEDAEDARRMLRMLSGRTHEVITGVAVVDAAKSPVGVVTARDALQLDALAFGAELMRREEITVIL